MASLAGAAAQKLQKANPTLYPAVQHAWCRLADDQLRVPSLCSQCFSSLQPDDGGQARYLPFWQIVLLLLSEEKLLSSHCLRH